MNINKQYVLGWVDLEAVYGVENLGREVGEAAQFTRRMTKSEALELKKRWKAGGPKLQVFKLVEVKK